MPAACVSLSGVSVAGETQTGVRTLKFFEQADDAVEWASDQLLTRATKMNFMYPDPTTGRCVSHLPSPQHTHRDRDRERERERERGPIPTHVHVHSSDTVVL
eukprot:COSAG05_NODE_628_length_8241_cov_5.614468_2_plen_102_part_00